MTSDQLIDHVDACVTSTVRQCAVECGLDHFLRGALAVIPRLGAVGNAATGEVGCPDRALTSPAGALLAEWLFATAAHFTTSLGGVGALTPGSQLGVDNLVQKRNGNFTIEDFSR